MSTTPNHLALSRAQFAQASEFADAGSTALARAHLLIAADHALLALAARSALDVTHHDRFSIALGLADIGAASEEVAPLLRDLNDDSVDCMQDRLLTARLTVGFGLVQGLIDSYFARPPSSELPNAPAPMPMYGGANGALNARGAEAAARALSRLGAAIKTAFRR
jgi:hypothetical protein